MIAQMENKCKYNERLNPLFIHIILLCNCEVLREYFLYWLNISASGDSVDATQELLTLGICNLLGSFASSFPVTGSFSRSAVNHASGVRTPFGGFYTGKS